MDSKQQSLGKGQSQQHATALALMSSGTECHGNKEDQRAQRLCECQSSSLQSCEGRSFARGGVPTPSGLHGGRAHTQLAGRVGWAPSVLGTGISSPGCLGHGTALGGTQATGLAVVSEVQAEAFKCFCA